MSYYKYYSSSKQLNSLSFWIFQSIEKAFEKSEELDFVFDFSGTQFKHTLNLVNLFSEDSKGYQWARENSKDFTKVLDVIQGINVDEPEKPIYRLHFKFDKTIFHESVDFTNIRCHSFSFVDTIFHKDAKFAFVDVEELIYKPYQLDVDVTFYHREKADMKEGKLRGDIKGGISTFHFRHHLQGSGKTYFVGVNFQKAAYFQDVILDNVVFSYVDRKSMSKCYFANSFLENTQFYKCEFEYIQNLHVPLSFLGEMKLYWLVLVSIFGYFGCLVWDIMFYPLIFLLPTYIFGSMIFLNSIFMYLLSLMQKIFKDINCHICVAEEKNLLEKNSKKQDENFRSLREIYRQLRINHEKHGDWQLAGEFYYSQRYCEIITKEQYKQFFQSIIFNWHHFVNGFGERWLRALVWLILTLGLFAWLGSEPNRDYVSTKSTPEYLLVAHKPMSVGKNASNYNRTYYQDFDESNVTDENVSGKAHFMLYSKTSYLKQDDNASPAKVFAYDDRFNYHYNEQYIPMLKNSFDVKLLHSLSKFVSPFTSSEKQWFQDRSGKAYFSGFLETMLLWLFFGGFVLAVKNKIKR